MLTKMAQQHAQPQPHARRMRTRMWLVMMTIAITITTMLMLIGSCISVVHALPTPSTSPCTLTYSPDGTAVILNNSLVAVEIDTSLAKWLHLYTYSDNPNNAPPQPPYDLIGNSGYASFDRANPDEVRPSNLLLTIVEQSDSFIHVAFAQNASDPVRNLPNFEWSFHYAIAAGLRGVYVWTYVWHPADRDSDYLAQYRFIIKANAGTPSLNYADAAYDSVYVSPHVLRKQSNVPQAIAGETLWPPEAELIYVDDDADVGSGVGADVIDADSRTPARRLLRDTPRTPPTRTSKTPRATTTTTFVQHKYDFSVDNRFHAVYGLVHSETALGMWMLSPSFEYKNGGPDSQDLSVYGPTNYTGLIFANMQMLNGNHYGSGDELVQKGEEWRKLYGPWLVYLNQGSSSGNNSNDPVQDGILDAFAQLDEERTQWPYAFIHDDWYAAKSRFTIAGQLVVSDPGGCARTRAELDEIRAALGMTWRSTLVFLTAPIAEYGPYTDQTKRYMYWAYVNETTGEFRLPNVVSGTYELHAWSDGVMGELVYEQLIVVNASTNATRDVQLGTVMFVPDRNASTLFEIGFPDRTALEYNHGDDYRQWGLWDMFAHDFPNGIRYAVGNACTQPHKQWRREWNYAHLAVNGTAVAWSVVFDVPATDGTGAPTKLGANAYLRIAFAGISYSQLSLSVNGQTIGPMEPLPQNDKSVYRDGIHGVYTTRVVAFPASVLVVGGTSGASNTLVLQSDCQTRGHGLMYDAMRLEVDGWTWGSSSDDEHVSVVVE